MSLSSTLLLASGSYLQASGDAAITVTAAGSAHLFEIFPAAGDAQINVTSTGSMQTFFRASGDAEIKVDAGPSPLQVVGARLMAMCYVSQIPESSGDNIYAPVSHITMRRGDNLILYLRFRDLRNNVYPLTTAGNVASIWFTVKARYSEPDSGALVQRTVGNGIYVTDGPTGEAQVVLTHAETSLLGAREYEYVWDVQIKRDVYGDESIISTAAVGTMTVDPDVTVDVATHVEVSS
jgi:hypothetical protein